MQNRSRTFWAAAVVLAGAVLALPFRRGDDDSAATPSGTERSVSQVVVHRRQAPVPLHVSAQREPSPAMDVPTTAREPLAGAIAGIQESASSSVAPTPVLATSFPTMLDPLGLRAGFTSTTAREIKSIPSQNSLQVREESEDADSEPDANWDHTISDRDTLSRIARRYWGSDEGFMAIYRTNRHVLRTPDELPIGAVIRVPAKPPVHDKR
jgi:nucleoid-associated protein YgaU